MWSMSWCAACATRSTATKIWSTPSAASAMFSNPLNRLGRAFSFRLNFWYASIFTVSACALYLFLYVLLAVAMGNKDREVIESQMKEYSLVYEAGGLRALSELINANQSSKKQQPFFVRLVNPRTGASFQSVPEDWIAFDPNGVRIGDVQFHQAYLRIPKDAERDFTLAAATLYDGSRLEVGRSTNNRETVLQPFRRVFCPPRHAAGAGNRRHGAIHH